MIWWINERYYWTMNLSNRVWFHLCDNEVLKVIESFEYPFSQYINSPFALEDIHRKMVEISEKHDLKILTFEEMKQRFER